MAIRDDHKSLMLVLASVGALGLVLMMLPPSENRLWVSFALFGMGAAGGYGFAWRMRASQLVTEKHDTSALRTDAPAPTDAHASTD